MDERDYKAMNSDSYSNINKRGFFEIGIMQGTNSDNLGMLWRSANIMRANGIFTIGARYSKKHQTDTMNTPLHIPLREFDDFDTFLKSVPRNTKLVAVELDDRAENLISFKHPKQAMYILGSEDKGIPDEYIEKCDSILKIPFYKNSFNVAVAGSIILYDRISKSCKNEYSEIETKNESISRLNELLEKRILLKLDRHEHEKEELFELLKTLPEEYLAKLDPEILFYLNARRVDDLILRCENLSKNMKNICNKQIPK